MCEPEALNTFDSINEVSKHHCEAIGIRREDLLQGLEVHTHNNRASRNESGTTRAPLPTPEPGARRHGANVASQSWRPAVQL